MQGAMKVTVGEGFSDEVGSDTPGEVPMSYAEAKEIALLRYELRACWNRADRAGARLALARLAQVAGNDNELAAEARRWAARFEDAA
jgi:hypothetical protein